MKNLSRTRRKNAFLEKDPDVLPFFSIHPKTKAGTIIRIAISVFCMLALLFALLLKKGIMFIWFQKYSYLLYLVPVAGLVLLICVALYKRMRRPLTKIGVPGAILFVGFAVFMTFATRLPPEQSKAVWMPRRWPESWDIPMQALHSTPTPT